MHFQSLASASMAVAPSIDKHEAFLVFSALFISRKIIPRAVIISFFILFRATADKLSEFIYI